MENTHSNFAKTQTKDVPKFSFIALVMAAFVFLITFLTALIATPSFLNHFATTIILWNIPLIIIAMLVFASVTEKRGSLFRWIAVACMALSFIFTNNTKNVVQDVASNASNYIDVAIAAADKEIDNFEKYEDKLETAGRRLEKKIMRKAYDSRRYYEEY